MIVDRLARADRYAGLGEGLRVAFDFLRQTDLAALPAGRHALRGDDVFALVSRGLQGRGRDASPLEYHRRYLDVQVALEGREVIGVAELEACDTAAQPFDPERDIGFVPDRPTGWLTLDPGQFAVFFPEDAHAPLAGEGPLAKVVVKVRHAP